MCISCFIRRLYLFNYLKKSLIRITVLISSDSQRSTVVRECKTNSFCLHNTGRRVLIYAAFKGLRWQELRGVVRIENKFQRTILWLQNYSNMLLFVV